jgi:uncharacterized membrane protein
MISDEKFGQELLEKIKTKHLEPKPKWQFLLKNYTIWTTGILSLILGAVSMSLIFYMLRYNEINVYKRLGGQLWGKLLLIIPIFWIICLIIFILIVLYNFKHTKTGYRHSLTTIMTAIISASIILGGIMYGLGMGKIIDDVLGRHAPFYDRLINPQIDFWSQPESGRLTGIIVEKINEEEYRLIDKNRVEWQVSTKKIESEIKINIALNRPARFLGEIEEDHKFIAFQILPTMPPGNRFYNRFDAPPPHRPQTELIIPLNR